VSTCPHCHGQLPDQGTLTWPPPEHKARRSDPQTSKDAAKLAFPRAEGQRRRVLGCLRDYGGGLTAERVAVIEGMPYVSVSTRISELRRGGWIEPHGKRPTSTGTEAIVWQLSAAAWEQLNEARAA